MRFLGIDGGIASVGWAVIEIEDKGGEILGSGTWLFDAPEEKGQAGARLKAAERRAHRGQRKVIRRRRQRMRDVRTLFVTYGLLPDSNRDALKLRRSDLEEGRVRTLDPWCLRVEGLHRVLQPAELAIALGHIARHRGFKSNAKGQDSANALEDEKVMIKASAETAEKLAKYKTPAQMILEDKSFIDGQERRFRNREGDYSRSLLRDDLRSEVCTIFSAQRNLGNIMATEALEAKFLETAFFQRPLQDSEDRVGLCPFVSGERRCAKNAPSFELFRVASRLVNLRLDGRAQTRLTPEELMRATADFGATQGLTFSALRKKLGLGETVHFEGIKREDEAKRDIASRSGKATLGTNLLRKAIWEVLGEMAWRSMWERRSTLDAVAAVLAFRREFERIREGLETIPGLAPECAEALLLASERGDFDQFRGAGHLSAMALQGIVPGLLRGLSYDKACVEVGYDHTDSVERQSFSTGATGKAALAILLSEERVSPELIGSPTARKSLIEALKQVKSVIEAYGMPDRIHIELARDIGRSIEDRSRIERGIDRRNRDKDKLRAEFEREIGRPVRTGTEDLLKYELWKLQSGRCIYTDNYISPALIDSGDNLIQVDHALPWGRFGDDSFHNRVLCFAKANQDKRDRTPYEWFSENGTEEEWRNFAARVEANPNFKGLKKRNLLLKNAKEAEERFRSRNLNDTRWTCRLLAEALRQVLPDTRDEKGKLRRRVFARPGPLTDRLRRAWGLQWLKKDDSGRRIPDDRHHALDAIVVAATSESLLQRATREVQEIEAQGLAYDLTKSVTPPWPGFREQALHAVAAVDPVNNRIVARAERRRARGKAHEATLRSIRERDGEQVTFEKKSVADLKLADLDRVKDAERNHRVVQSLRAWIEAGKPKDAPPLSPTDTPNRIVPIRKVQLRSKSKVNVTLYRGGENGRPAAVDQSAIVRVDVFRRLHQSGKSEFFLVPIYPTDIVRRAVPPNRAVSAYKPEAEWPIMEDGFDFLWSLMSMSYVRLITSKGEVVEGYFRSMNRSTGAISISPHENATVSKTGIGVRTLRSFEKYAVDRLGGLHRVNRETRTWRGKVCT